MTFQNFQLCFSVGIYFTQDPFKRWDKKDSPTNPLNSLWRDPSRHRRYARRCTRQFVQAQAAKVTCVLPRKNYMRGYIEEMRRKNLARSDIWRSRGFSLNVFDLPKISVDWRGFVGWRVNGCPGENSKRNSVTTP